MFVKYACDVNRSFDLSDYFAKMIKSTIVPINLAAPQFD